MTSATEPRKREGCSKPAVVYCASCKQWVCATHTTGRDDKPVLVLPRRWSELMENTNVSWADSTFNPWVGCQKVSLGCDSCYAEALMDTRFGKVQWGPEGERKLTSRRQPGASR